MTTLIIKILILALIPIATYSKELPKQCKEACSTTYGSILGTTANGLKAYSNCNSRCVIFDPANYKGTYTGIKWQCVEFARRWLLKTEGVVYGDVDYAYNIWDSISYYESPKGWPHKKIKTKNIKNGEIKNLKKGDLIIYSKAFLGTGHVAVIVDVLDKEIKVAEENYSNTKWTGNYSRSIKFTSKNKKITINDKHVLGIKVLTNIQGF